MLHLRFKKTESGVHIAYTREDGSSTWSETHDFFARHDLVHFTVESTFGFSSAFFGLIEQGRTIQSFEEKETGSHRHQRLPEEAYIAEIIVGHLDNMRHSPCPGDYPVLAEIVQSLCTASLPVPTGLETNLREALNTMNELLSEWAELPTDSTLEKMFPLPLNRG